MDDSKADQSETPPLLSSSESTPSSEGIAVYMDHLEVKVQFKDDPIPTRRYPFKTPWVITEPMRADLAPYAHRPIVSKTKFGHISVGGKDHLSTNGRRLLLAKIEQPMPHVKKRKKAAIETDNQLTDQERVELEARRGERRPWEWQVEVARGVVEASRHVYSNGLLKEAGRQRFDPPYPFPLFVNTVEFYCEVKIADRGKVIRNIERAISESQRFGSPKRTDDGVKGRENYCRWNATIKDQRGKDRDVAIKSYTKGGYQRIEIQFKGITTEEKAPQDVYSIFTRLWELGRLADRILNEVVAGLDTLPEASNPTELRDAIAAYCMGTKTNKFDFFVEELIRFGVYSNANRKGRGLNIINSIKRLLRPDGILEIVDNLGSDMASADGRSLAVRLRVDWKEQVTRKREQDQLKRKQAQKKRQAKINPPVTGPPDGSSTNPPLEREAEALRSGSGISTYVDFPWLLMAHHAVRVFTDPDAQALIWQ